MPIRVVCSLLFLGLFQACSNPNAEPFSVRIGLGSCLHQDKELPLLERAASQQLDAFIFLGDNIYGDTRDMSVLRKKYQKLGDKPEFQTIRDRTRLIAVWDDHDYGENDAGRHYSQKDTSKEIFLDFWEVPDSSQRRTHAGIYGTEWIRKKGIKVQCILLDTRTFRDNLIHRDSTDLKHKNDYIPNPNPDSTLLGQAQWEWLEEQLRIPADLRIIATSNQFGHSYNGWESWTNVPHERKRMIQLIQNTRAKGVVFISGDVHWGELSRLEVSEGYPLYDLTSSGISETWDKIEPNNNRIGPAIPQNNFGLIELEIAEKKSAIHFHLYDLTDQAVLHHEISLDDLSF